MKPNQNNQQQTLSNSLDKFRFVGKAIVGVIKKRRITTIQSYEQVFLLPSSQQAVQPKQTIQQHLMRLKSTNQKAQQPKLTIIMSTKEKDNKYHDHQHHNKSSIPMKSNNQHNSNSISSAHRDGYSVWSLNETESVWNDHCLNHHDQLDHHCQNNQPFMNVIGETNQNRETIIPNLVVANVLPIQHPTMERTHVFSLHELLN